LDKQHVDNFKGFGRVAVRFSIAASFINWDAKQNTDFVGCPTAPFKS
jgi:hypothetical protein